ncbi:unnamed protein product, partial [Mesorhabditis belari]|uniref:Uncharacterized protein n=1 Tax=Mesorhabditis belari TaxID=2138241 RepID=A0AAF3FCS9_9BILA
MKLGPTKHRITTKWTTFLQRFASILLAFGAILTLALIVSTGIFLKTIKEPKNFYEREFSNIYQPLVGILIGLLVIAAFLPSFSTIIFIILLIFHYFFMNFLMATVFDSIISKWFHLLISVFFPHALTTIFSFRATWKLSRKGPSEAPLGRLLENCMSHSLGILLAPTFCYILLLLVCLPFSSLLLRPLISIQISAIFEFYLMILIFLPPYLFLKQKGALSLFSWSPLSKCHPIYNLRLSVEEKYIRLSHFLANTLSLAITKLKIVFLGLFAVQFFIIIILLFGQLSVSFILASKYEIFVANGTSAVEFFASKGSNRDFWCILVTLFSSSAILSLFTLRNIALSAILMCSTMNSVLSTGIIIMGTYSLESLEAHFALITSFLIAFDLNLKFCLFYRGSHRGSRTSRSSASFHQALSSFVGPTFSSILLSITLFFCTKNTIYTVFLFVLLWNLILVLFFTASLLTVAGPIDNGWFCGGTTASQYTSECTDRMVSTHDLNDTRRFSSVNYSGLYKKRMSLSVAPSVRRASMPVVALANSKHNTPGCSARKFSAVTYMGKRGMSIDGVSLPGNRSILRKEPLLHSQHSINSQHSIGSQNK